VGKAILENKGFKTQVTTVVSPEQRDKMDQMRTGRHAGRGRGPRQ